MPLFASRDQYIMPALDSAHSYKLGFLTEMSQEGENFIKAQRSWADIDKAVDIISGSVDLKIPKSMSQISANILKRDIRENVATLSNMRPLWGFKTENDQFQKQAKILNDMLLAWYLQSNTYGAFRSVLQYAMACGLGWAVVGWDNSVAGGRGDIAVKWYGPRDVLPYGLPKDKDCQKAYSMTICDEMPIQQAMMEFPLHLKYLSVDRSTPTWMRKGTRRVQRFLSPLLNAFGPGTGKEKPDSPFPTVQIYRTYILDQSINTTSQPIIMGQGTNWEYTVPVYGSEIDTGTFDKDNQKLYRKATAEDAKMFPIRRLVKWTKQGILYDGTATSWHGRFPGVPFTIDDWPWDLLGYSAVRDGASLQQGADRVLRALDDMVNVKLDSPLAFDDSALSQGLMDRINPRKPGQRVKINMQQNEKPIVPIIPSEYYQVDSQTWTYPDKLHEYIHFLLGTRDIQALAKAKQVPAGDSMEKLMELSGPLVTDMSRGMERSMIQVGELWKGDAMQHYTMKRRVQVLGKDGVSEEDYDYDPMNMIPSHTPDEFELIKQGKMQPTSPSREDIVHRAKAHLNSFYFHITPNSMHQITQITKKMLYLQMWKAQFPLDPWSMAEVLDIPNFGTPTALAKILDVNPSDVPSDVMGRWIMFKELMSKLAPPPPQKGRHPSGQTPPTTQGKDGGQRTTVRESPR
jgi:hypothetical protein